MENIKKQDKSELVRELQELLVLWGYALPTTSYFGDQTHKAVCDFQRCNAIVADGVVGIETWNKLKKIKHLKLSEDDIVRAAALIDVEVEVVKAVKAVETGATGGFLLSGQPVILFERHIFYRQLKNMSVNPIEFIDGNEDILSTVYGGYTKGIREYNRLERAMAINRTAALSSASWGLFQIMGFNHKMCECASVDDFVDKMSHSEGMQLELFVEFIKFNGYDSLLRKHNWSEFARRYNGKDYARNEYDKKLQNRYDYYTLSKK